MKEGQKNERESLRYLIAWLIGRLEEVEEIKSNDENQFAYGEKTAYAVRSVCKRYGRKRQKTVWISI